MPSDEIKAKLEAEYRELLGDLPDPRLLLSEADVEMSLRERFASVFGAVDETLLREAVRHALADQPDFGSMLESISSELDEFLPALAENEVRHGAPPLIADLTMMFAEYPTGQFNAQVRALDGRSALVLVNSALLHMLQQMAKLIVLTTAIVEEGFQYWDNVRLPPLQLTPAQAMADVVDAYLRQRPGRAGFVARPPRAEQERVEELLRAMVMFVVAHEYAHALGGHLGDRGAQSPWGLEGEADWLAVRLMLSRWRWGDFVDDPRQLRLQTLLSGPLLFFGLEQLVAAAEQRVSKPGRGGATGFDTHPPAVMRTLSLRALYQQARLPLALADLYAGWVDRIAPGVLEILAGGPV